MSFYIDNNKVLYNTRNNEVKEVCDHVPNAWTIYSKKYINCLNGWDDEEIEEGLMFFLTEKDEKELESIRKLDAIACELDKRNKDGNKFFDHCIDNDLVINVEYKVHRESKTLGNGNSQKKGEPRIGGESTKLFQKEWKEVRDQNGNLLWVLTSYPHEAFECTGKDILIFGPLDLYAKAKI